MSSGTEVCLLDEDGVNFGNIFFNSFVTSYPEFFMMGNSRYRLVFSGDGTTLACYRRESPVGLIIPANQKIEPARREIPVVRR